MGLAAVRCCKSGDPIPLEECLEHAATRENSCEFTREILAAMFDASTAHPSHDDPSHLSASALTSKCFRSTYLQRTEDYTEDPKRMWAAFRGTMFHGRLEQYAKGGEDGNIAEARYIAELPEIGEFSGSPDLVDIGNGFLYDYKFVKEVPRWDKVWPDHIEQLNINRWLVDHAHTVVHEGTRYDLTAGHTREKFVPVEWQGLVCVYMDDRGPKPVLAFESIDVPKKDGKGTKKARVPAIWDNDYAQDFIISRYKERRDQLSNGILPPIPPGYEGQGHPLCGFCPVRERCRELELQEIAND